MACSSNETSTENEELVKISIFDISEIMVDSTNSEYLEILKGIRKSYTKRGWEHSFISHPDYDSLRFKDDSLIYINSYKRFFQQDLKFIKWLLSFKSDTTLGGLWQENHEPTNSYIGECIFPLKKNRAAIILIENYLNGSGIICYECINDPGCNENKYKKIETFLAENNGLSIDELREKWKMINTH